MGGSMGQVVVGSRTPRRNLLELAAGYVEDSVLVTSIDMELPGPEILYVNTAFTKMTGYAASELIGKSPRLMQGPLTDRRTLDRLKAAVAHGDDFIARAINYRRDGTPFELEWIITHLRDTDGRSTHLVAVQRDITGIERAAAELAAVDDELRVLGARLITAVEDLERAERLTLHAQRMAALGRMARGISHDLEDSLAPMAWILEELEADTTLRSDTLARLGQIRSNLDHAIGLNQRLLEFAGGKDQAPRQTLDVRAAVEEVIDLTRSQRSASGRPITFDHHTEAGVYIDANPVELRQILMNLTLNAVEAMPRGGTLTLRSERDETHAIITVSDSGEGMDALQLDNCFEPFFSTRETGTGLGLSICHSLVTRYGGTIEVTSEQGSGTTFVVRLPLTGE